MSATKESVILRQKKLAKGRISLYLDIYIKGDRKTKTLDLYLQSGTKPEIKAANANTLRIAETMRAQMLLELANKKAGIFSSTKEKMPFVDYVQEYHDALEDGGKKRIIHALLRCVESFDENKKTELGKVDKRYCLDLIEHIRKAVSENSAAIYVAYLRTILTIAHKKEHIRSNPFNQLYSKDIPKQRAAERGFLTIEELKQLENNKAGIGEIVVQTFFFSAYCGLRYSDIAKLTWANLQNIDGRQTIIITMKKTKQALYLPLNEKALLYLPQRNPNDPISAPIFNIPTCHFLDRKLKKWAKIAGIDKNISFHIARHTYATMLVTKGADIFTISKLLGHTSVKTTQIYAEIVSAKKNDAVDLLNDL